MTIALLGGPLDGSVSEGLSHMPLYMIATNLIDRPIYKRICCLKWPKQPVPYLFVGYEKNVESQQSALPQAS
jgi:hypothetical protein